MKGFVCPVSGCEKELSRLQVMHFRSAHDCDPSEWVATRHGTEIREVYSTGRGSYSIAREYEWLSPEMVTTVVDTRTHEESVSGEANPMRRDGVVSQFQGDTNPAKDPKVRERISEALTGRTHDESTKRKISRKNTGNTINEEHRKAVSEAASSIDRSYMQTEEYSQALSEALKGREPTYPTPYTVDELSHEVRSSWEEDIGKLLTENDIDYKYEPEFKLSEASYYPDFVTETSAIEVKGFASDRSVTKAEQFLEEYPSFTYVVIGDELPCDIHIPWEDRSRVVGVAEDG